VIEPDGRFLGETDRRGLGPALQPRRPQLVRLTSRLADLARRHESEVAFNATERADVCAHAARADMTPCFCGRDDTLLGI
jgi:hypothetical protein